MKRTALLHAEISDTIARLGHGDLLVIGDAGLPIPPGPRRIDLALTANIPRFIDVLRIVLGEMQVEAAILASEIDERNPLLHKEILTLLPGSPIEQMPHEDFKALTARSRAMIRTGEFSPYANIILRAGVVF